MFWHSCECKKDTWTVTFFTSRYVSILRTIAFIAFLHFFYRCAPCGALPVTVQQILCYTETMFFPLWKKSEIKNFCFKNGAISARKKSRNRVKPCTKERPTDVQAAFRAGIDADQGTQQDHTMVLTPIIVNGRMCGYEKEADNTKQNYCQYNYTCIALTYLLWYMLYMVAIPNSQTGHFSEDRRLHRADVACYERQICITGQQFLCIAGFPQYALLEYGASGFFPR